MSKKTKQRRRFRSELWQDGFMVVCVEGPNEEFVAREIRHYVMMYDQDGPLELRHIGWAS